VIEGEFDSRTFANMNVALERACAILPKTRDNHPARKLIAEQILACARSGKTTLGELTAAAKRAVTEITIK
jgi:hypothetical protein